MKPISSEQDKKQDRKWEEELFREGPDSDFTLQVMQKLDHVSMEDSHVQVPWETKKSHKSKWIYRTGIAVAAAVLIAGGAWVAWDQTQEKPVQPPLNAVNIPPLPNIPVPEVLRYANLADDYKRLQPLGLVVNPNIDINDQGYKLKIEDVLVDRSQLILMLQQTAPDGTGMYLLGSKVEDIHVTDENGKSVAELARDTRQGNGSLNKLVFQLNRDIPDEIIVRGNFGHLNVGNGYDVNTKTYTDKKVSVDWSFQFKLDMTQAKGMSKETPMDASYTTPEGLELAMTQSVQTPNGTRLDLEVNLNDELRAKAGEEWAKEMDILYHIEVKDTGEYRIFNGGRPNARQAKFRYRDLSQVSAGGPLKISETWDPSLVTLNADNIRFVLDGYTIPVKEEQAMEVDLDKASKESKFYTFASFNHLGDQIDLHRFNYERGQSSNGQTTGGSGNETSLVLEGSGLFQNEFYGDHWVATDSTGKEYPVEVMGIRKPANLNEQYVVDDVKLIVHGFNKDKGTKLTLKRTVVHRDFRDVDWKVNLASDSSMPWDQ